MADVRAFSFDKEEFTAKGKAVYEQIKADLEPKYKGKFVAIEPESGDYFLGETMAEADEKGREKYPDKLFFFTRVGYPAACILRRR
jgi:hypothetical protein